MKVLLIGGTGQAGSEIRKLECDWTLIAPSHRDMAIGDSASVARMLAEFRPDVVINTSGGFDDVYGCESRATHAFETNVVAIGALCRSIRAAGARLVTFSTDYVFGGDKAEPYREDDLPLPVQVYGMVRLAEEHMVRAILQDDAMIIRTSGVFGAAGRASRGGNFVDKRIAEAAQGGVIDIACEQLASPAYAVDIAKAIRQLVFELPWEGGIYHIVNEGQMSWYEITRLAFSHIGWADRVRPIDRGGLQGEMRRPLNSALANVRARARGVVLPPLGDALRRYLQENYPDLFVKA